VSSRSGLIEGNEDRWERWEGGEALNGDWRVRMIWGQRLFDNQPSAGAMMPSCGRYPST